LGLDNLTPLSYYRHMLILSPQSIGRGYRQLQLEEPIRTTDEWYSVFHQSAGQNPWRISSYWTSDGMKHPGKVPYRRPTSFASRVVGRLKVLVKTYKWLNEPVTKVTYTAEPGPMLPNGVSETVTKTRWRWWL
jgi:hypothetical protein